MLKTSAAPPPRADSAASVRPPSTSTTSAVATRLPPTRVTRPSTIVSAPARRATSVAISRSTRPSGVPELPRDVVQALVADHAEVARARELGLEAAARAWRPCDRRSCGSASFSKSSTAATSCCAAGVAPAAPPAFHSRASSAIDTASAARAASVSGRGSRRAPPAARAPQVRGEVRDALVARRRILAQRAGDDRLQLRRRVRAQRAQPRRVVVQHGRRSWQRRPCPRRPAARSPARTAGCRRRRRPSARRAARRGPARATSPTACRPARPPASPRRPGGRRRVVAGGLAGLVLAAHVEGEAEVQQLGQAAVGDHDVGGLDVAVHDTALVGVGQRVGERQRDVEQLAERSGPDRRRSRSVRPCTYSKAMQSRPSASPISWIVVMFGWFRAAAARASCRKRARRRGRWARAGRQHLSATSRCRRGSCARKTSPMPPAPSSAADPVAADGLGQRSAGGPRRRRIGVGPGLGRQAWPRPSGRLSRACAASSVASSRPRAGSSRVARSTSPARCSSARSSASSNSALRRSQRVASASVIAAPAREGRPAGPAAERPRTPIPARFYPAAWGAKARLGRLVVPLRRVEAGAFWNYFRWACPAPGHGWRMYTRRSGQQG